MRYIPILTGAFFAVQLSVSVTRTAHSSRSVDVLVRCERSQYIVARMTGRHSPSSKRNWKREDSRPRLCLKDF